MSLLNLILPVFQQPDSTEDPKVNNALNAIQTWANGAVDFSNFAPSGNGVQRNFCNNSGGTLYPQLLIYALGY